MQNCGTCEGSGTKPGTTASTCSQCGGQGQVVTNMRTPLGVFQQVCCGPKSKIQPQSQPGSEAKPGPKPVPSPFSCFNHRQQGGLCFRRALTISALVRWSVTSGRAVVRGAVVGDTAWRCTTFCSTQDHLCLISGRWQSATSAAARGSRARRATRAAAMGACGRARR